MQGTYPAATATAPAPGPALGADEIRAQLSAYLDVEYPGDAQGKQAMLNLFGSARLAQKIADAGLRASLVAYSATARDMRVAEFILNARTGNGQDKVQTVAFDDEHFKDDHENTVALVWTTSEGQMRIFFNGSYRYERFPLLACTFLHEVLHQDSLVGRLEEAINSLTGRVCEIRQLARHPELASIDTSLARYNNTLNARLLNSRDPATGNIDIFADQGKPFMPGSAFPSTRWWDDFKQYRYTAYPPDDVTPTPGNDLLQSYYPLCNAREFNFELLQCVNAHLEVTPEEMIAAMNALELDLKN